MKSLPEKPKVLVLESCAHHRQADDIGTVKIPRLFRQKVNSNAEFSFLKELPPDGELRTYDLVINCAACMATRNLVMNRLEKMKEHGVAATNYGLFLAWVNGLLPRAIEMFPDEYGLYREINP